MFECFADNLPHFYKMSSGGLRFLNVGVQEQLATYNPYVCGVCSVLADEVTVIAQLNVLAELWIFGTAPLSFNDERRHFVHVFIGKGLGGIGLHEKGLKFFGDFDEIYRIVRFGSTNHPSIFVNIGYIILLEKFFGHLLPCVTSGTDANNRAITERFFSFEGIHEKLTGHLTVHEKSNERLGFDWLGF